MLRRCIPSEDIAFRLADALDAEDGGRRLLDLAPAPRPQGVLFGASLECDEVKFEEHSDLIRQIADNNAVPVDLIRQILKLEPNYRNLHAWGVRPALRRALAALVDEALSSRAPDA